MLSFKTGVNARPIAVITGGRHNKKIIYVHDVRRDDDTDPDEPFDYASLLQEDIFTSMPKRKRYKEHTRICRLLRKGNEPVRKDELFERVKKFKKNKLLQEIKIRGGEITPFCNPYRPQHMYTAGPTDCGKSTSIAKWAKTYHKFFPKNKIYLFSRYDQDNDPAFKGIKIIKIMNDDDLVDFPPLSNDYKNSMVIFDDCSTIRDKEVFNVINEFRQDLLETGRKKHIYVCVSNHLLADHQKTKENINECQVLICYRASGIGAIEYALKKYYGMDTDTVRKIKKLGSRWLLVSKSHPQYCIYDRGVFLI